MKKATILPIVALLLASCTGAPGPRGAGSPRSVEEGIRLVRAACFEVVTEKATHDSLSYDKPLNWDLLGYTDRNEKYLPLGTAFAISATELVSAAHVLDLTSKSLVHERRFIREKVVEGGTTVERVYEIADVRSFDNRRDYVVFTVKGRTFDTWLALGERPEFNTTVYTAGDAYGEGIVVREGRLLDTVPEEKDGAWRWLKSSVATNPGSSGGPLLDERFRAIGIVISRKDDFCYSLPTGEIRPGTATVHHQINFSFTVFDKTRPATYDQSWPLPMEYRELINANYDRYMPFYRRSMDELLSENAADLFPRGPGSAQALFNFFGSTIPEMYLRDSTTGTWFSTTHDGTSTDIGNGGSVTLAQAYENAGVWLIGLEAPADVPAGRLWDEPRVAMDLLLKGIRFTRKVTSSDQGSRIVSYGAPLQTLRADDRFGRPWQFNAWVLEHTDEVIITAVTPTPSGLAMLWLAKYSADKDVWLYDLGKMVDFVNVSYVGTLRQWGEFLRRPEFRTGAMKDVAVAWSDRAALEVETADFRCRVPLGVIDIDGDTVLGLYCSVFLRAGSPVYGVRKLVADSGDGTGSYYTLYRWSRPSDALPKAAKDTWQNSVVDRGHPYSGRMYVENGQANIGSLHPSFLVDGRSAVPGDFAYTIFLSKQGSASEDEMAGYLAEFGAGMEVRQ